VFGAGCLAALVVMLIGVASGVGDGDSPAPTGPFAEGSLTLGIEDGAIATASPELIAARLDRIRASGARVARVEIRWVEVAAARPAAPEDPDDPAYAWGRYDTVIDGLAARGVEPLAAVSGSPAWANGGRSAEWAPDPAAYRGFVRALIARYDGVRHARLRLLEVWDQPNDPLRLMPQWTAAPGADPVPASPGTYAGLVGAARAAVSAARSDVLVIGPSTGHVEAGDPAAGAVAVADFLAALAPLRPELDALSVHLTPSGAPNAPSTTIPSYATLPRLVDELARLDPDAPVLVTRFGYATADGVLSEADQAAYLTQALERLAAVPRIRLAVWHQVQDTVERSSGLVRADGSERPAWGVFVAGPAVRPSAGG
jgi:hypothetical protein